jgi:hypothetical protein
MEARRVMSDRIQWTGDNLAEVQAFVGVMENMDGDVSTVRFLEPEALNYAGERIWEDSRPRLWIEEIKRWVPVDVGEWIAQRPAWRGYFRIADES